RDLGLAEWTVLQPHYNLVEREFEATLLPVAEAWDLAVVPYFGLAKGFRTGDYRAGAEAVDWPRAGAARGYLDGGAGQALDGAIDDEELLTFRQFGSRLEGHPTPRIPPTDVATGSLGQGLPIGVGLAVTAKRLDRLPYRVWVLCGDSELAEGSIWEAFQHAGWEHLDNLVAIIDVNRLGQTRETMLGWNLAGYADRIK